MADLDARYRQAWNEIKVNPDYEFGLAQSFVATILSQARSERFSLEQLLEDIQADAFSRGINIPNLDLDKFRRDKLSWENQPKDQPSAQAAVSPDDFHDALAKLCTDYPDIVGPTKGLFIFRLVRGEVVPTIPIFICDQAALKHPKICSLDDRQPACQKEPFDEFIKIADRDHTSSRKYLAALVVTPSLKDKDNNDLIAQIEALESRFERVDFISPLRYPIESTADYQEFPLSKGVDSVRNHCEKVLNNRDLSRGDEEIIKQCFEGKEMVLDYKFLKKGNTGAKVIEVRPHQGNIGELARFVVKYGEKDRKRKLVDEKRRFKMHVQQHAIDGYDGEFVETPTHDAILYRYASSDGRRDSFEFAKIVDGFLSTEKKTLYLPGPTVSELFESPVLQKWSTPARQERQGVGILYKQYLTKADDVLMKARNIDPETAKSLEANYRLVEPYALTTKVKVCHGDLHTENFFKDEKGVYLIDFGWTDTLHAVIDHTTLEASLKFKHLPFYLSKEYVTDLERKYLLGIESFDSEFDLSDIDRGNADRETVKHIFGLICSIRENAKEFMQDSTNPLEYLISLYIISFRQIYYPDLNQRYALASTDMLGKEIVKRITPRKVDKDS